MRIIFGVLFLSFSMSSLWAAGKPKPRRGTYFSAVYKNYDKSLTFVGPRVSYGGGLLKISAWSKAEGVCRVIWGRDVESAQIQMSYDVPQTMMRLGSGGQSLGPVADNISISSITCKDD